MNNLGLPIGADPSRDIPWGTDELGNQQFRTANGTIYSIRQQATPQRQTQPGTMARVGEVAKGLLSDAIQGIASGVTAPRRALEGGDGVTGADALNLAGLLQLGGGVVTKPRGALGANALRGGGMSDPTQTGWTFRDVDTSLNNILSAPENRRISADTSRIENVPIRSLNAMQETVNPDFATTASSAGELPLVVRKGGKLFVRDGHHRLTKIAESGGQTANVRFIDLDNVDTSTPLLDWSPEKTGFVEADNDLLDQLFSANRSATAGAIALPVARNEAEAMARQILEMRAAGRAGDVTDAMMAAADPQYMYANTPLPMDEASRMARAREAGFQGGLLHGTGSDISAIDPTRLGEKQNVLGKGFYQTTSPERSERYVPKAKDDAGNTIFAEGGNVMPLMSKSADEFDLTAPTGKKNISRIAKAFEGTDFNIDLRDGGDSVFIQSKTDPKTSVFLDSYQEGQSTLMRLKDAFGNNNLTPILEEAGFTGLKGAEGRGSNVRVNYNPEDVRSRFARFDPAFSHLSNLNAANVSPEVGLLATQPTDADKEAIMRYLGAQGLLR